MIHVVVVASRVGALLGDYCAADFDARRAQRHEISPIRKVRLAGNSVALLAHGGLLDVVVVIAVVVPARRQVDGPQVLWLQLDPSPFGAHTYKRRVYIVSGAFVRVRDVMHHIIMVS